MAISLRHFFLAQVMNLTLPITGAEQLSLEIESIRTTSQTFALRVFVQGLAPEPWLPQLEFAARWDPSKLALIRAEKAPAIADFSMVRF